MKMLSNYNIPTSKIDIVRFMQVSKMGVAMAGIDCLRANPNTNVFSYNETLETVFSFTLKW